MGYRLLLISLVFLGLSGLGGGFALTVDPTGQLLGLPLTQFEGTSFLDYRIPGLVLLTVLGVLPLVVAWALHEAWGWSKHGALLVGGALVVWITVEILVVGYQSDPPLQVAFGTLGLLILALAVLPSVRNRFEVSPSDQED